ncbi:MAG: hypothetical protein UZ17_ACD001002245 [Acidobacteria bacterium OLB17]|nr:MAG: hypothetical protein UZ17_ACD001002245 [Acidobacteria bacterium OLB17]MCZ2389470.1 hypothetical protein [Acidobacteriota bacterium]
METATKRRFGKRTIAFFWLALVAIIVTVLIVFEQISILYVLATLSLVWLLLTVAFADLEHVNADGSVHKDTP